MYQIVTTAEQEHWLISLDAKLKLSGRWLYRDADGRGRDTLSDSTITITSVTRSRPGELIRLEELRHLPSGLRELELSRYRIPALPRNFGALFPHLTILKLHATGLTSIPDSLGLYAKNLAHLYVIYSRLERLPDTLGRLTKLTHLSLEGNPGIEEFPMVITEIRGLQMLNLLNCSIRSVPPEIQCLFGSLMDLVLGGNRLTDGGVPWDSLAAMPSLRGVYLGHNPISRVPRLPAGAFHGLLRLDLRHAHLMAFPEAVLGIASLKILNLSANFIPRIPPEIARLTNLEKLTILRNPALRSLPIELTQIATLKRLKITQRPVDDQFYADNATILMRLIRRDILEEM